MSESNHATDGAPATGPTDGGDADAPAAIGYVRLSQESDRSIDAQKADIRSYASENGLRLADVLDDGARTSGFDGDRAEYQRLRELVTAEAVDAVVVRDQSRLSRNKHERLRFLLELDESPVELHSVERGEIDTSDFNLVVETAMATADDEHKRKEIERAREETRRRVEQGYYQGKPPFGFTFDDEKKYLVPGDRFGEAVDVLDAVDAGASYREVAAETDVSKSTVGRIVDRRETYERYRDDADGERGDGSVDERSG